MKKFFFFAGILFAVCHISKSTGTTLSSPQVTNFGEWQDWEYCPQDTYVVGMQLKNHPYQGPFGDDSALNGVRFFCDRIGSMKNELAITSGVGIWGTFGQEYSCHKGVATGFQLRSASKQLVDDSAANNLRIFCNKRELYIEGDGLDLTSSWTKEQHCFDKQAICGIQTQIAADKRADRTGMDNLRVECCDIPNPAEICIPKDTWELIIECDNTEAVTPTTCSYERRVGVSHSTTESEGQYEESEIYKEIGFSLTGAISGLSFNFGTHLAQSTVTGYDWSQSNTEIWSAETTTSVSFDVPPGVRTQLLQTIGSCGFYNAKTTRVKRIDTHGKVQTISYTTI